MPRLHTGVSEGDDGGNLGLESGNVVLNPVANIALRHFPGVIENSRRLRNCRS